MKPNLHAIVLITVLFFYTLPGYNNLYGKSISSNKIKSHTEWNKNIVANVKHNSNNNGNSIGTLHVSLYLLNPDSSTKIADGVAAQYGSMFSDSLNYLDALKFTNINENFALLLQGTLLSIERRSAIVNRDTLFFNLTKTSQRSYQLQFTATGLSQPGLFSFFKDSYTGDSILVNLEGFTVYNFSINSDPASKNPNRFMMVYEPIPGGGIVPVTYNSIKAWQNKNDIDLEWKVENEMNIKTYTVEKSSDGHIFNSIATIKNTSKASSDNYDWVDANVLNGENYYRVRSTGIDGTIQYSEIVKVNTGINEANVSVYPNPVKGGIINMQLNNMPKGIYQMQILNSFGQSMATKLINHTGGSASQTISVNSAMPKGLYELEIIQPDESKVTYKIELQ